MDSLKEFLADTRHRDFAEKVGISPAYLSQILSGARTPSLDVACLIEDATGGVVPVRSWQSQKEAGAQ